MGKGPILRPLVPSDVPALADLWVRSWQETLPAIDFEARRGWFLDFIAGPEAAARATIVALENEVPLGFVTIEPRSAYLHQLAVAPSAKGGALAYLLLEAAKHAVPEGLALDVNAANARAIRFYEREGFQKIGEGINEASGLTTWRMHWRL